MSGMSLHKRLENNAGLLIFGILFVASIGGLVQGQSRQLLLDPLGCGTGVVSTTGTRKITLS